VALFCLFYFLGNLVIPGSILTGLKGLREGFSPAVASAASH